MDDVGFFGYLVIFWIVYAVFFKHQLISSVVSNEEKNCAQQCLSERCAVFGLLFFLLFFGCSRL